MTCSSCSSTVESVLQTLPGVKSVAVDLIGESATVVFAASSHDDGAAAAGATAGAVVGGDGRRSTSSTVEEIVEAIEDVGFEASVLTVRPVHSNYYSGGKLRSSINTNNTEASRIADNSNEGSKSYSTFGSVNTANISTSEQQTSKTTMVEATFALEGLTCATCVNAVSQAVKSLNSSATDNNSSAVDLLPKQRHPFVSEASLKELIHQVKGMLQSGRSTVEPCQEEEKPRKEEEKPRKEEEKPRIYPREYLLW